MHPITFNGTDVALEGGEDAGAGSHTMSFQGSDLIIWFTGFTGSIKLSSKLSLSDISPLIVGPQNDAMNKVNLWDCGSMPVSSQLYDASPIPNGTVSGFLSDCTQASEDVHTNKSEFASSPNTSNVTVDLFSGLQHEVATSKEGRADDNVISKIQGRCDMDNRESKLNLGKNEGCLFPDSGDSLSPIPKRARTSTDVEDVCCVGLPSTPPIGRWAHSTVAISSNKIVVVGGQADEDNSEAELGDVHCCIFEDNDMAEAQWVKPLNCESIARAWHASVFLKDKHLLVTFGGEKVCQENVIETLTDIQVLDTQLFIAYPPAMSGKIPSARSGHTLTLAHNGSHLVLFGGINGRKWVGSAVDVLDTNTWAWKRKPTSGSPPLPRSYHTATATKKGIVFYGGNSGEKVFNDVILLTSSSLGNNRRDGKKCDWYWDRPIICGNPTPRARTGHIAILLQDEETILIHGGWDPDAEGGPRTFGDTFLLNTRLWEWQKGPTPQGNGRARVGHTAVLMGSKVFAYGGQDEKGTRRSDFLCFDVTNFTTAELRSDL